MTVNWRLPHHRMRRIQVKGGARAYFHGGLSLQELVIPVIKIRPRGITEPSAHGEIKWELVAGSRKLSTRFLSVQIRGRAESLLAIDPPRVRVEIREGTQILSVPVSASWFEEATERSTYGLPMEKPSH